MDIATLFLERLGEMSSDTGKQLWLHANLTYINLHLLQRWHTFPQ